MIAGRARQRIVAGLALGLAVPVLVGCGFDSKDETSHERSQVQTADNQIGAIRIRNAFLTTPSADPTATSGTSAAGAPSGTYLVVTLINEGTKPDTFTGITTSLGTAAFSAGPVTLPPGVVVEVSDPQIDATDPSLLVTGTAATVGTTVGVQFSFAAAGTSPTIAVPVVSPGGGLSPLQVIPTDQATPQTPIV